MSRRPTRAHLPAHSLLSGAAYSATPYLTKPTLKSSSFHPMWRALSTWASSCASTTGGCGRAPQASPTWCARGGCGSRPSRTRTRRCDAFADGRTVGILRYKNNWMMRSGDSRCYIIIRILILLVTEEPCELCPSKYRQPSTSFSSLSAPSVLPWPEKPS